MSTETAAPVLRIQAFIAGEFVDGRDGRTFPTFNPANGDVLADIASCGPEDVDVAVRAARDVFERGTWSRMAPHERKRILLRFALLIEANAAEIATIESLDAGKPITDCRQIDIPETIETYRWFAEYADKLYDSVAPTGPDALGLIRREPIGVVAAVLPWNFPALMMAWKCAPALAAGNSVIVKPAKLTTLSALRIAGLAAEAGIPPGVFNILPGSGAVVGEALGRHPDIDVVSFTGSTEVGRGFLRYSADSNLKEVVLELGGKCPQVVLDSAPDLDLVVPQILDAAFWNMGENCSAGSRLLVQRGIYEDLLERVARASEDWVVGDPQDPETQVGPLVERAHFDKVMSYVDAGRAEGAKVMAGGQPVLQGSGGNFLPPTVFGDVSNDMAIAREEIFGPVLAVIPFDTEAQAVQLANDTAYGLAASLWTTDVDAAQRLGGAIKAGTVSVNCYSEGDVTTPFGGYKQSGFGGRDKSVFAFEQYTQLKTLWIARR